MFHTQHFLHILFKSSLFLSRIFLSNNASIKLNYFDLRRFIFIYTENNLPIHMGQMHSSCVEYCCCWHRKEKHNDAMNEVTEKLLTAVENDDLEKQCTQDATVLVDRCSQSLDNVPVASTDITYSQCYRCSDQKDVNSSDLPPDVKSEITPEIGLPKKHLSMAPVSSKQNVLVADLSIQPLEVTSDFDLTKPDFEFDLCLFDGKDEVYDASAHTCNKLQKLEYITSDTLSISKMAQNMALPKGGDSLHGAIEDFKEPECCKEMKKKARKRGNRQKRKISENSTDFSAEFNAGSKDSEDVGPKKKRKVANYFVAIRISSPEIHDCLKRVQKYIIEQDERLARCMIPVETSHITLMVMHVSNSEEHSRAMNALMEVYNEFKESMLSTPLKLEFRGLGHFRNKVVFVKIPDNEAVIRMSQLVDGIKNHFENAGILITDEKTAFMPHLTVMKLSRAPLKLQKALKKGIATSLYEQYKDQIFGTEVVKGIQLLRMCGPKTEDGYYVGDELLFGVLDVKETKTCS